MRHRYAYGLRRAVSRAPKAAILSHVQSMARLGPRPIRWRDPFAIAVIAILVAGGTAVARAEDDSPPAKSSVTAALRILQSCTYEYLEVDWHPDDGVVWGGGRHRLVLDRDRAELESAIYRASRGSAEEHVDDAVVREEAWWLAFATRRLPSAFERIVYDDGRRRTYFTREAGAAPGNPAWTGIRTSNGRDRPLDVPLLRGSYLTLPGRPWPEFLRTRESVAAATPWGQSVRVLWTNGARDGAAIVLFGAASPDVPEETLFARGDPKELVTLVAKTQSAEALRIAKAVRSCHRVLEWMNGPDGVFVPRVVWTTLYDVPKGRGSGRRSVTAYFLQSIRSAPEGEGAWPELPPDLGGEVVDVLDEPMRVRYRFGPDGSRSVLSDDVEPHGGSAPALPAGTPSGRLTRPLLERLRWLLLGAVLGGMIWLLVRRPVLDPRQPRT